MASTEAVCGVPVDNPNDPMLVLFPPKDEYITRSLFPTIKWWSKSELACVWLKKKTTPPRRRVAVTTSKVFRFEKECKPTIYINSMKKDDFLQTRVMHS